MTKAADLANLIGNINAGGGGVNRNVIINGAMNVAQRSTSETVLGANTSTYRTVDRFKILTNGTAGRFTMSQDSSAPSGFANSTKFDCTTADTSIASGEYFIFRQIIEGQNLQAFAKGTSDAKPFAVSFYVKGNASATYNCVLGDEDNTRQSVRQFTVGTDWSRVELTFPADTTGAFDDDNAGSLEFNIYLHAGSDFTSGSLNENVWEARDFTKQASGISSFFDSTDRTFFITGVQLEVGQNPTAFEHEPFERTLAKCQRYYQVIGFNNQDYPPTNGYLDCQVNFPTEMRAVPSAAITDGTKGGLSATATAAHNITTTGCRVENQTSGNGSRAYHLGGSVAFSSEL